MDRMHDLVSQVKTNTDRVGSAGSEQGLLGIAFHPKYKENGFFYVNYTNRDGDTLISRFQVQPGQRQKLAVGYAQPQVDHLTRQWTPRHSAA